MGEKKGWNLRFCTYYLSLYKGWNKKRFAYHYNFPHLILIQEIWKSVISIVIKKFWTVIWLYGGPTYNIMYNVLFFVH